MGVDGDGTARADVRAAERGEADLTAERGEADLTAERGETDLTAAGDSDADVPRGFESFAEEPVPQAAVGSPGKDGRLELAFAADDAGRTRLVRDYARVPFHVSGSLDHAPPADGTAVYVQSPTGGVAQGDRLAVDVAVGPDATALVSTGSATKVQSMTHNYARERVALSVGAGGHLEWVPEATILHADARFARTASLTLAPGASAVLADVVVPGRLARGEAFDFDRYLARVVATVPGGRLFEDATRLDPARTDPRAVGVLGDHDAFGHLYVVAPDADESLPDRLHERVAGCEATAAASALPNGSGAWVRALGDRSEAVTDALHAAWDAARRRLIDAPVPDLRKY